MSIDSVMPTATMQLCGSQESLLGRLERIKKQNQAKIDDINAVQELFEKNPELLKALELIQKIGY